MLAANEYLPIGTVVLLKNAVKKLMVVGIMPSRKVDDNIVNDYDYVGVTYPEGFINTENLLLFNHEQISDVIYSGYENPERIEFVDRIHSNMEKLQQMLSSSDANGAAEGEED